MDSSINKYRWCIQMHGTVNCPLRNKQRNNPYFLSKKSNCRTPAISSNSLQLKKPDILYSLNQHDSPSSHLQSSIQYRFHNNTLIGVNRHHQRVNKFYNLSPSHSSIHQQQPALPPHSQSVQLKNLKQKIAKYLNQEQQEHQQVIKNNYGPTPYDQFPKNKHKRSIKDYLKDNVSMKVSRRYSWVGNSPKRIYIQDKSENTNPIQNPRIDIQKHQQRLFDKKTFSIKEIKLRRKGCNPYAAGSHDWDKKACSKIPQSYLRILYSKGKSTSNSSRNRAKEVQNCRMDILNDRGELVCANQGSPFYLNCPPMSIASKYELQQNETASNFYTKKRIGEIVMGKLSRKSKQSHRAQRHRKASHKLEPWERDQEHFEVHGFQIIRNSDQGQHQESLDNMQSTNIVIENLGNSNAITIENP